MTLSVLFVGIIIVLAGSSQGVPANSTPVQVEVDEFGRVNGYQVETLGQKIDCFLGIPFAKTPTGDLRFRPPQPLPAPSDTPVEYNATELPPPCYQTPYTSADPTWRLKPNMSEDCLYLNIWKPEGASDKAVMVWIYGGGFAAGSSTLDLYDGKVLAAKGDVIVASMQYRLGPLGFLFLGSESAPGNAGMLDQQLALDWIHKHVADFGGDPQRVTIFGESAGAGSVGLHLLSPGSDNLFRSAILQSGSPLAVWSFVQPEEAKKRAYELAELVDCTGDNVIECMREKSARLLTDTQHIVEGRRGTTFTFIPTIDHKFLMKSPAELLKAGEFRQKNILLGTTSHEGALFAILSFPEYYDPTKDFNNNVTREEYRAMVNQSRLVNSSSDVVIDTVASVYALPCDHDGVNYFMALSRIFGDVWFNCPVLHMTTSYARENKVYMYAFNHRSSGSPWPLWAGDALHAYEIDHVFGIPFRDSRYNDSERTLSGRMITYWTNFAKTGDPNKDDSGGQTNQTWPEYSNDGQQVLVLDTGSELQTETGLRDSYCQFWSDVVPRLRAATETTTPTTDGATVTCDSVSVVLITVLLFIAVALL